MLAILIMFFKHNLSLSMYLRWLHKSLSGLGVDELLHLAIVLVNSSSENRTQVKDGENMISLRMFSSIWQCWAILKEECITCHRSLISRQGWSLYLIASIASSFHLLTQFMSSQDPHFLLAIFWILRSKNKCFVFLTVLQKIFQSFKLFNDPATVFILPALGVFHDIDDFQVLFPSTFDCIHKIVDSSVQTSYIWQIGRIEVSNGCGNCQVHKRWT